MYVYAYGARLLEDYESNRRDQQDAITYKDTKIKLVQDHKDRVIGKVAHYMYTCYTCFACSICSKEYSLICRCIHL